MDGQKPLFETLLGSSSSSSSKSVPIEHMDYGYIDKCKNVKELEQILGSLRSGVEGYYPDLIEFCEKKIASLDPKSKTLRKDKPPASMHDVGKEEWKQLNSDIKDWTAEMGKESDSSPGLSNEDDTVPPIRKSATINTQGKKAKSGDKDWGKPSPDRIKSSDYRAWDKYDADAEAEGVGTEKNEKPKVKEFNTSYTGLTCFIDTEGMSDKERELVANKEKDKGNEAFKAGDYEEAVHYYTRSISVIPSAPSYNNRSLARIKLGQFLGAVEDCTKVLELEPDNIKALLRRGTARKSLREFSGAKEDLGAVLKVEPNNKQARDLLADILQKEDFIRRGPQVKEPAKEPAKESKPEGRRMVIQEVEGDSESEEEADGKGQKSLVNGTDGSVRGSGDQKSNQGGTEGHDQPSGVQSSVGATVQNQDDTGESVSMTTPPPAPVIPALPLPDDVIALKDSGNELFKAGQYGDAMTKYTLAIDKILPKKESFSSALATLYSNRAACNSKTGHLKDAITDCDSALEIQPYSVKAMLRRGAAYETLEKYRHAYIDYQSALKIDTVNQSAQSGSTRMIRILLDQDGPKWREKLPPSPSILGLPLPPPSLTTMAPSNATVPSVTSTTNAAGKPAMATATSNLNQQKVEVKGQEPKGQNVKGQEVKDQEVKGQKVKGREIKGQEIKDQEIKGQKPIVEDRPDGTEGQGEVKNGSEVKDEATASIDPKLSKEENFMKLKAEGNALVQQGNYSKAMVYYTACIALDSSQAASYTNRALCFIKLLKGNEAETDCTHALELDGSNIKALYRRALARKLLLKYSDSARDLTSLLKIEPNNTSAKKELEQVKELWRKELKSSQQKNTQPPPQQAKPTEVKPTEVKPTEVKPTEVKPTEVKPTEVKTNQSEKKKKKGKRMQIQETEGSSGDENNSERSIPKPTEGVAAKDKKGSKTPRDTGSQKGSKNPGGDEEKIPVPKLTKVTAYEFLQAWTSLKRFRSMQAYAGLLRQVPPEELPEVLTNKLDGDMLVDMVRAVCEHLVESDGNISYGLLANLPKVERFKMIVLFLSGSDKKRLRNSLKKLSSKKTDVYTESDLEKLRQLYGL